MRGPTPLAPLPKGKGGRGRHVVGAKDELPAGARKIVRVGRREIGVFHTSAGLFAVRNSCPHQGAPLCLGTVGGTVVAAAPGQYESALDGRVLRCPWHGWEFDLATGQGLYDPAGRDRVATYEVRVEGDEVVVVV
jgi:3-phenylpropionate/trans-cinnamate dioxygenase ferredoxin subunit